MILESLFGLLAGLINLIPFNLPQAPERVTSILEFIFDGITGSLGIVDMFIDLKLWISCAITLTIIYNIKHIWNTFIFIINLIPSVQVSYWN